MTPLLEARSVGLLLSGSTILDEVSLSVDRGEFVAVIGPNGAGKSSLLKCLGGLIAPTSGDVLLEGRPLRRLSGRAIARKIAWIPQSGTDLLPFAAREFVALSRYAWRPAFGAESRRDHEIVNEAIRLTELNGLEERRMSSLSGGERQRVLLAAALAQTSEMLFLDEPATSLDYRSQAEVEALVRRVNRERNIAVVMVTHDVNTALRSADRVIALKGGRLAHSGEGRVFADTGLLREIFDTDFRALNGDGLSMPYIAPRSLVG